MAVAPELLERARLLREAGAFRVNLDELASVHAALFPGAEPVRTGCRNCVMEAWQVIARVLRAETPEPSESSFSSSISTTMANSARFDSDTRIVIPHNSGTAYTNENLTDAVARYIIEQDPDAKAFFSVLPADQKPAKPAAGADASKKPASTTKTTKKEAEAPKQTAEAPAVPATPADQTPTNELPELSDSLSRADLEALYTAEVGGDVDPTTAPNKAVLIAAIQAHRDDQTK